MKLKTTLLALVLCLASQTFAQSISMTNDDGAAIKKNNLKISLTSLAFKNFQFQYERSLSKRIGVVVGYGFIPEGALPFQKTINELTSDNPDTEGIFENATLAYTAITPEVRFYLGKGYGKGFYIAPFYRNVKYDISNVVFTFDSSITGTNKENLAMGGKLTANSFGLQLGAQFNLGKHIILDWWIVGPHYGTSDGNFLGVTDRDLNAFEQNELRNQLEDIELPLSDIETTVTARGASIKVSGPWGGIRSGISLGYRF